MGYLGNIIVLDTYDRCWSRWLVIISGWGLGCSLTDITCHRAANGGERASGPSELGSLSDLPALYTLRVTVAIHCQTPTWLSWRGGGQTVSTSLTVERVIQLVKMAEGVSVTLFHTPQFTI